MIVHYLYLKISFTLMNKTLYEILFLESTTTIGSTMSTTISDSSTTTISGIYVNAFL